ncbi:AAA family ATPase [uncultured Rheinheimera sp.]|uniref:AAA family ATPase n=1 Tax=uncultured Rheinheimera sp. TaxID=400532 RepID=UPI002595C606|nr:AAA family ATPase [uncultured Rheinheimera sp.]
MDFQKLCVSNQHSDQCDIASKTTDTTDQQWEQMCLPLEEPFTTPVPVPLESQTRPSKYGLKVTYGTDGWDTPVIWLVPDFIPGTGVGTLVSASMGLKTFVAVHLAGCITSGTPFLGMPARNGLVFYVAAEGASGLPRRLKGFELQNNADCGQKFVLITQPVSMVNDDERSALRQIIKQESESQNEAPVLLVIDTFSQCSAGIDENSAGQVAQYINYATQLANEFSMAVLIVHHTSKSGGYRGSSALLANMDFALESNRVKPESPIKTVVSVAKSKEGATGINAEFHLSPVELGLNDNAGRPVSTLVVTDAKLIEKDAAPHATRDIDMSIIQGQFTERPTDSIPRDQLLASLSAKFPEIAPSTIDKRVSQACSALVEMGILLEEKIGRNKAYRLKHSDSNIGDSDDNDVDDPLDF